MEGGSDYKFVAVQNLRILVNVNVLACVVLNIIIICCINSRKIYKSVAISRSLHLNMFSQELALTA